MQKSTIIKISVLVFLILPLITFAEAKELKDYKIIKGDTLWDITKQELNNPFLWPKVWEENAWIANPHLIYPDQMIRIPLYLNQGERREDLTAVTSQDTAEAKEPVIFADQRYQRIKGIILKDGSIVYGKIISMNAFTVKIREASGDVKSYAFEREVENFIKE